MADELEDWVDDGLGDLARVTVLSTKGEALVVERPIAALVTIDPGNSHPVAMVVGEGQDVAQLLGLMMAVVKAEYGEECLRAAISLMAMNPLKRAYRAQGLTDIPPTPPTRPGTSR
jgi:hypothetical protein